MKRVSPFLPGLALILLTHPAMAQIAADHTHMPPGAPYQKVSTLVELPDFVPGVGILYVNPATLPAGPFLAYDRSGDLVSTVYMIPLKAMNDHKSFDRLLTGAGRPVDHVDIYYNAGHPGVAEPHYHIVLWYVSPQKAQSLSE